MKQWRVSWEMWVPNGPHPSPVARVYDNEEEARDHLEGLYSMQTDHPPRPCSNHVWNIKLEERVTEEWKVKP